MGGLTAALFSQDEKRRLEFEVERLQRQLADRKLLERAKGVLQSKFAVSEEEAYLRLRRSSRQTRLPMREIAKHVIEHAALPVRVAGAMHGD